MCMFLFQEFQFLSIEKVEKNSQEEGKIREIFQIFLFLSSRGYYAAR